MAPAYTQPCSDFVEYRVKTEATLARMLTSSAAHVAGLKDASATLAECTEDMRSFLESSTRHDEQLKQDNFRFKLHEAAIVALISVAAANTVMLAAIIVNDDKLWPLIAKLF